MFFDVTVFRWIPSSWRYEGFQCLCLQGQAILDKWPGDVCSSISPCPLKRIAGVRQRDCAHAWGFPVLVDSVDEIMLRTSATYNSYVLVGWMSMVYTLPFALQLRKITEMSQWEMKLRSFCNRFKWSYRCTNLRQIDHLAKHAASVRSRLQLAKPLCLVKTYLRSL